MGIDFGDMEDQLLLANLEKKFEEDSKVQVPLPILTDETEPRILIVEDNNFSAYALTSLLEQYQIRSIVATDGVMAQEMVS